MDVLFIDGEYKGCEALVFTKGIDQYFKDNELNCDVLLDNHLHINKNGVLSDIVLLLDIANNSKDKDSFIKAIDFSKIKEPLVLRPNRINNFFDNKNDIEKKFIELVELESNEQKIFGLLLTYINDKNN